MLLYLKDFCERNDPWGSSQGKDAYQNLQQEVSIAEEKVIGISLKGLIFIDPSFFRECVSTLASHFRGEKYFFLCDINDPDIMDNCRLGSIKHGVPFLVKGPSGSFFIGPEISEPNTKLLDYVINHGQVTTPNLARDLKLSVQNASTRLKRLTAEGYLIRKNEGSPTGGREFVYATPIS